MMLSINLVSSDMLLKRKCATHALSKTKLNVLRLVLERNVLSVTRQEKTHMVRVTKLKISVQDLLTFKQKLRQLKLIVLSNAVTSLNLMITAQSLLLNSLIKKID